MVAERKTYMAIRNVDVTLENISNKLTLLDVENISIKDAYNLCKTKIRKIVSVSNGNDKMGRIVSFSTLPGNKESELVEKIPGTCGEFCKGCIPFCYAARSCKIYPSTKWAYAKNTLLKRTKPALYWALINHYIEIVNPLEVRINVSGELEDVNEIVCWNKIARNNPGTKFYSYTKNYKAALNFKYMGQEYAPNFIIHLSGWQNDEEVEEVSRITGLPIFYYVNHKDPKEVAKYKAKGVVFCPGIDKNGKHTDIKCESCPLCKGNYNVACFSH